MGLKDKTQVKIFGGDICKVNNPYGKIVYICWENGGYGYYSKDGYFVSFPVIIT